MSQHFMGGDIITCQYSVASLLDYSTYNNTHLVAIVYIISLNASSDTRGDAARYIHIERDKAMPNWNFVKRQLKFDKPRYLFTITHIPKTKTQMFYDKNALFYINN